MDKRKLLLIGEAVLGAVILAAVLVMTLFVSVGSRLYFRFAQVLDLQDRELTVQEHSRLREKLPDAQIFWNVPFQGGSVSSTQTELKVTELSDADVGIMSLMEGLETVDGRGCDDYAQLVQLQRRRPEVRVLYEIPLQGKLYDQDTASVALQGLTGEEAALLPYLMKLEQLDIDGLTAPDLLDALRQQCPDLQITYTVPMGDRMVAWDQEEFSAAGVTAEQLELIPRLLPALRTVHLDTPQVKGDRLLQFREEAPQIDLTWEVRLYGTTVAWDIKELDISGIQVSSCEDVEAAVVSLPYLEKLIMSDCGIDNETMAAYRERVRPEYKVVWTVYLSDKTKARTDDLYFMPIQQGEYYFKSEDAYDLRYCEDMICLDLGHHMINEIEFVAYMPHLKYLILAHTRVRDLSPLVNCQELVYLELDWSEVQDYSPLVQIKSLEDLNVSKNYADIAPLLEMTWLKNLWIPGRSRASQAALTEALPNTHLQLSGSAPAGQGWRDLPNYFAMRDVLGMHYMK